ncbi:MAG TPA: bifunctional nuclease family protein [Bacteroidales bacterium]|nr:bifunctional nuclease family protein [Bacteroidales bacterium]
MSKIKLNVLGISYSHTQSGAYALVLAEEKGPRRIPIIVGSFEAQAIAIQLEGLNPPRPLTHDLFYNFATLFKIDILEVNIYKLEEGIFFSKLTCFNGKETINIDSRTSDAIALALRFSCPIYTTEDILKRSGITLEVENETKSGLSASKKKKEEVLNPEIEELRSMSEDELKEALEEAINTENYERASKLRDEINRRNKQL